MRTYILSSVLMVLGTFLFAQPPQKMSYQCVVRNVNGVLVTNQSVGVRISILQGTATGTPVYVETKTPTTNANGLVTIEIGSGAGFDAINWASGLYFLKTETDPAGGNNYTISGTSQLLSVPYALYSKTSGDLVDNSVTSSKIVDGTIVAADLAVDAVTTDKISTGAVVGSKIAQTGASTGQALKWDGTSWAPGNDLMGSNLWTQSGSNIYYNNGSVGIGTLDPGTLLQVHSNTTYAYAFTPIIRISDNFKEWNIGLGDTDDRFSIAADDYTERFTIMNSSGYVGMGTGAPAAGLHLKGSTWPGSFIYLESGTGGDAGFRLYEGSAVRWHIYNNSIAGGLHIENNALVTALFIQQSSSNVGIGTTTPFYRLQVGNAGDGTQARANAWNILSDARLKKNFTKLINPLKMVEKLNGYYFYWNSGIDKSRHVGFSAQQVSEVIPEVVSKGEDGYLSLEYSKMAPLLVEAIKELKAENDKLQARLDKIEKLLGFRSEQ